MTTRCALSLLRPLHCLTQAVRRSSTCSERGLPPPCPPCEPQPPPPCRRDTLQPVTGRRVVCCPPPQGSPPPCLPPEPACALSCENRIRQRESRPLAPKTCDTAIDAVAERLRCFEEHHRRAYERDAAERLARVPPPPPAPRCALPRPDNFALATDGRTYGVCEDAPPPRCPPPTPPATQGCITPRSAHPPPQPVLLSTPRCGPKPADVVDPCKHAPRTLLSIDRGARNAACSPPDPTSPPKRCQKNAKSKPIDKPAARYKKITSRIMNSLRSGRGTATATPPPPPGWCANMPRPAPAPPRCRPPTFTDRLKRGPLGPHGSRRLHTAGAAADTGPLSAALEERDRLHEAGRGRVVRAPSCELPPSHVTNGGDLVLGVPAGVDTVCVHVSMGWQKAAAGGSPTCATTPALPPACGTPPPCEPPVPPPFPRLCPRAISSSESDSWLSIKKLQKKISSSCGRSDASAKKAKPNTQREPSRNVACPTVPRPPPPTAAPRDCPKNKVKIADVLPQTEFVRP